MNFPEPSQHLFFQLERDTIKLSTNSKLVQVQSTIRQSSVAQSKPAILSPILYFLILVILQLERDDVKRTVEAEFLHYGMSEITVIIPGDHQIMQVQSPITTAKNSDIGKTVVK